MQGVIDILAQSLAALWPCYNPAVQIVNFPGHYNQVGGSGTCPHCAKESYFRPVGGAYLEANSTIICNAAQCEACKGFALVVGRRNPGMQEFSLAAFYPLGRPNDAVDRTIPARIADDFREALRCRWIEAYKATVTMCRRAIQASCIEKNADRNKKLVGQIDELAGKGVITQPLREFAHEVRLEGNDGAHPDADGLENVTPKDADDIIEFTREYLHHVYVMPAKLQARKGASTTAVPKP